jgi:hypothetical protein
MCWRLGHRYGARIARSTPLFVLACLLALFLAYVLGRAIGILLGVGPWPTTALAMAIVLVVIVRRAARSRK